MEVGNVMEVWDDVETEAESEESDDCMEDIAEQEFEGDSSEDEISRDTAGPSTSSNRNVRPR